MIFTTDNKQFKYLPTFAMLLVTIKLVAMLFVGRNLLFGPFEMPGGIIPFCTTFLILDIVTNNYGLLNAKKLIFSLILCESVFSLIIYFTLHLTPFTNSHELEYQLVTFPVIRLFFGSFFATICAYFLNCYIFSKLYTLYSGRKLWLRCILSTAAGEIVFSIIWTFIYFHGNLQFNEKLLLIADQYLFKVLFEIITLPITYIIVYFLSKYETPFDIKYVDLSETETDNISKTNNFKIFR
ncbi:MAG: queuosine precursor transporter [Burkholderiales bacterium]|nr:queuosine precursor transporter [Burkholderiales bacterium]